MYEIRTAITGGVPFIELAGTEVEAAYRGAGNAILIVEGGELTKLIYENQACPAVGIELNTDQFYALLAEHGVYLDELEPFNGDQILLGHCSAYTFCFPWEYFGESTEIEIMRQLAEEEAKQAELTRSKGRVYT
ncbi:hypothetical protein [Thalassobacillus devorans]|uniref:hypothetical protein n=1 Tax=Thalassobacillus devorans TaxID=279813 RepID=UPI000A1C95F7|nr:hypothetical protein [Thalassobacillus devorans]